VKNLKKSVPMTNDSANDSNPLSRNVCAGPEENQEVEHTISSREEKRDCTQFQNDSGASTIPALGVTGGLVSGMDASGPHQPSNDTCAVKIGGSETTVPGAPHISIGREELESSRARSCSSIASLRWYG
jgi:hypothetical protein